MTTAIDVSTTMIIQPGPVVDFLIANQNVRDPFSLDWSKLCSLVSLQRYTKALSTLQRSSLVEKSRQKPNERMKILSDALKSNNCGSEPMLRSCGISINTNFTQVEGRVLPAPRADLASLPWSLNVESFRSDFPFSWIQVILDPLQFLRLQSSEVHNFQLFAAIVLDSIWMARNRVVHDNAKVTLYSVLQHVLKGFSENTAAWRSLPVLRQPIPALCLRPSSFHHMTFDVAVRSDFSMAAAVLFDSDGNILEAWTQRSL
ncbi:Protein argonaute 4 [Morella rubra]|uniref:Protein argonaute 4 n=1 Tax=Morella rubra TaxID=262757 RepID=A0A6A1W5V1_9ROSI|nr:Protein argonaute 4 [Morella rubra]